MMPDLLTLMQHTDEPLCPANMDYARGDMNVCRCMFIAEVRKDERDKVLKALRWKTNVVDSRVTLTSRPTDTQSAAARKAVLTVGTRRKEIHDLIVNSPDGMTDDEIEIATGYTHQSASGTRNSLMRDGFIWDSGERRKNRRGNLSIVWKEAR